MSRFVPGIRFRLSRILADLSQVLPSSKGGKYDGNRERRKKKEPRITTPPSPVWKRRPERTVQIPVEPAG